MLEDAFKNFAGTLLFVSHDRSFINALATRVIDVSHGRLESHLGNYDVYLERTQRAEASSAAAATRGSGGASTSTRTGIADGTGAPNGSADERPDKLDRQRERERRKGRERDVRKLEKLEARIAEEEARIESLKQSFAAPEVYQDHERLRALQAEQSRFESELEALYREWESLSDSLADS